MPKIWKLDAPRHVLDWAIKNGFITTNRDPARISARQLADKLGMACSDMTRHLEALGHPRLKGGAFMTMNRSEVERVLSYIAVQRGARAVRLTRRKALRTQREE
jgi:predicted NUDIX family NTP pyrophosphohydrolase